MHWVSLITRLLMFGPGLLTDGEAVFQAIAHSKGGADKIIAIVKSLETLLQHAATAAVDAGHVPVEKPDDTTVQPTR